MKLKINAERTVFVQANENKPPETAPEACSRWNSLHVVGSMFQKKKQGGEEQEENALALRGGWVGQRQGVQNNSPMLRFNAAFPFEDKAEGREVVRIAKQFRCLTLVTRWWMEWRSIDIAATWGGGVAHLRQDIDNTVGQVVEEFTRRDRLSQDVTPPEEK